MTPAGPPPPERVPADVDAARESLAVVVDVLDSTIARASALSDAQRDTRVDDEWSAVESIRHLVFVIDIWLGKLIQGADDPFHPIGLPPHFVPSKPPGSSVDPDARPTFDEACEVLRGRLATLTAFIDALTSDDLARPIGTHAETVAGGLGVIFDELTYHAGFMNRDLDVISRDGG